MSEKHQTPLLKKAQFWAHILGRMPGVSAVFLSGSLAQKKATKHSDIDFFIVGKHNKLWTARFFVNSILKISGNLAKKENHDGQICPNHFISNKYLEIVEKDAYSANLFSHNIPLYDPLNLFQLFKFKNQWVKKFGEKFHHKTNKKTLKFKTASKKSFLEKFLEKIQKQKIIRNKKNLSVKAKIILNNHELRFHPDPKNQYFKEGL